METTSFNIVHLVNPPQTKIRTLSLIKNEIEKHNRFFMIMLAIVKLKKLEIKVKKKQNIHQIIITTSKNNLIMNQTNSNSNEKIMPSLPVTSKKLLIKRSTITPRQLVANSVDETNFKSASFHLKYDFVYGDHKLKICGKNDLNRLPTELKSINRYLNNIEHQNSNSQSTLDDMKKKNLKKKFVVLDLSTERETCLNFPLLYIPHELFEMRQLKRLHLDCNHIKSIPEEFGVSMVNLEILTISNNRLKWLPMSMKNLKKLESIHLSRNKFDLFPIVLCQIRSLKFLDLSSNFLFDIPNEIENLTKLESFLLFQNNIRSVPITINGLNSLRTLWLGSNQLTSLPEEICELKELDWTPNNFDFSSNIADNPILDPPMDICLRGIDFIREYFYYKKRGFFDDLYDEVDYDEDEDEDDDEDRYYYTNNCDTITEEMTE